MAAVNGHSVEVAAEKAVQWAWLTLAARVGSVVAAPIAVAILIGVYNKLQDIEDAIATTNTALAVQEQRLNRNEQDISRNFQSLTAWQALIYTKPQADRENGLQDARIDRLEGILFRGNQ